MTLGILRIAAVLEKAGVHVEVLDLSGIENYCAVVADYAFRSDISVYGITSTTPQLPAAILIAMNIRGCNPYAKVVLGGPHVTLVNAAARKGSERAKKSFTELTTHFDMLLAGDGEQAVFRVFDQEFPKLIDADNTKSELFLTNDSLTALPFPARHLVDVSSYHYSIDGVPSTSLIAQLGCPFGCGFCGGRMSPMLRKIRTRTTQSIIEEMKHLYDTYGFRGFMFYDDELNVNPQMIPLMKEIAKLAHACGTEFKLRGFIKAELFTMAQADAMHEAGFRWILTGFESGSPRILKNIQKRATRKENTRCMNIARAAGLKVKALMSIGHPGESEDTIAETEDWLLEVRPDDFDATIITTYPGTPYYDSAVQQSSGDWKYEIYGDSLYSKEVDYSKVADYYKGDPNDGYVSYVYTDNLSSLDLVRLRNDLEKFVRHELSIPFNPSFPAQRYEHSMGQLPAHILKASPCL